MFSTWLLVLGSWFLVLGSWLLVLGSWFLALGSWLLNLELLFKHFPGQYRRQSLVTSFRFARIRGRCGKSAGYPTGRPQ